MESGTLNLEFCVAGVPPASPARRDGFKVLCSRFQVLHPLNLLTILTNTVNTDNTDNTVTDH